MDLLEQPIEISNDYDLQRRKSEDTEIEEPETDEPKHLASQSMEISVIKHIVQEGASIVMVEEEALGALGNHRIGIRANPESRPKLATIEDRIRFATTEAKRKTPKWQYKILDLSKVLLGTLERLEGDVQRALLSLVPISPEEKLDDYEEADITTLLYLAGEIISWIRTEPKDTNTVLQTIFSELSKVADFCVTCIQIIEKTSITYAIFNVIREELQHTNYQSIINANEEGEISVAEDNYAAHLDEIIIEKVHVSDNQNQNRSENSSTIFPYSRCTKPGTSLLIFRLKKKNIIVKFEDNQKVHIQDLAFRKQVVLTVSLLHEIIEILNNGFKGLVKAIHNDSMQEHLFKMEHQLIPEFIGEAKRLRKGYQFDSESCSTEVELYLRAVHQKIIENDQRMEKMFENTRWILLALESINQQTRRWAFPHEINHLEQAELHGVSAQKKGSMNCFRRKNATASNIVQKILPFEKMFKNFRSLEVDHELLVGIDIENDAYRLLIKAEETKDDDDISEGKIFLSCSEIDTDRASTTLTGRRKTRDLIFYLPERRPTPSSNLIEIPRLREPSLCWVKRPESTKFWGRTIDAHANPDNPT